MFEHSPAIFTWMLHAGTRFKAPAHTPHAQFMWLSVPSRASRGGFRKLKTLLLTVPVVRHLTHDFLAAMTCLTYLMVNEVIPSEWGVCDVVGGQLLPWGVCQEAAVLTSLKCLNINACAATPESLDCSPADLAQCLSSMPMLEELDILVPEQNGRSPCSMVDWKTCASLTSLTVTHPQRNLLQGSAGKAVLEKVACMQNLRYMWLQMCGDLSGLVIQDLPLSPHLTGLALEDESFGSGLINCTNLAQSLSSLSSLGSLMIQGFKYRNFDDLCESLQHHTILADMILSRDSDRHIHPPNENVRALCDALRCHPSLSSCYLYQDFSPLQMLDVCSAIAALERPFAAILLSLSSSVELPEDWQNPGSEHDVSEQVKTALANLKCFVNEVELTISDRSCCYRP